MYVIVIIFNCAMHIYIYMSYTLEFINIKTLPFDNPIQHIFFTF